MRRMGFTMLLAAATSGLMPGAASAADVGQPYTKTKAAAPLSPPAYDWSGLYAGIYTAGARAGYNWQLGTFVVGGEANVGHLGGLNHDVGDGGSLKETWNSGVRVRAGVAIDHALFYGLVGYNLARFEAKGTVTSGNKWNSGFDVGAGFEYALTKNVSIGLEYDYSRFDNIKSTIGDVTKKNDFGNHSIRAGLNFRF